MVKLYLSPDGEEWLAGGIHEHDLTLTPRAVVIDSEHQASLGIKNGKAITVE